MKRSMGCLLFGLLILLVSVLVISRLPVERGSPTAPAVLTPEISCTPDADNLLCTYGYISHCPCYQMQMETYQSEQRTATSTP